MSVLRGNRTRPGPLRSERRPVGVPAASREIPDHQLDPQALGDHIDRLYRAALAMCGSREEAEDLVQETFARVLRRPRTVKGGNDMGYLMRSLRNTFLSSRRAVSRRPRTCRDQLDFIEDQRALRPEASLEAAGVYAAISALPDD